MDNVIETDKEHDLKLNPNKTEQRKKTNEPQQACQIK